MYMNMKVAIAVNCIVIAMLFVNTIIICTNLSAKFDSIEEKLDSISRELSGGSVDDGLLNSISKSFDDFNQKILELKQELKETDRWTGDKPE